MELFELEIEETSEDEAHLVKVYFNPFAFTIEQNNEFLRLGYEPAPMRIPPPCAVHGT